MSSAVGVTSGDPGASAGCGRASRTSTGHAPSLHEGERSDRSSTPAHGLFGCFASCPCLLVAVGATRALVFASLGGGAADRLALSSAARQAGANSLGRSVARVRVCGS